MVCSMYRLNSSFLKTGSGKTYTMGTNYTGEGGSGGIIPRVMENIFQRVESMKESAEFLTRVSFIEVNNPHSLKFVLFYLVQLPCWRPYNVNLPKWQIFKEEVFDLLDSNSAALPRGEVACQAKPAVPARVPIQIRETVNGGITLAGVTEAEVRTKEEMASYLSRGSLSRATGSTNMNSQSRYGISSTNVNSITRIIFSSWIASFSYAIFICLLFNVILPFSVLLLSWVERINNMFI